MRVNGSKLLLIVPLIGGALAALPLRATSNLIENSPFMPGSASAATAQQGAPLELRSILKEEGEYEFSLYDPGKKQSTWSGLNETGHEFTIKAFDRKNEIVTVEFKNRTYKLGLKESKIELLTMAASQQPGGAGALPNGAQENPGREPQPGGRRFPPWAGMRGPVGSVPSLTSEQLHNIEADINRRRELRRQAAQQSPLGPRPQ
jgi:hypothetical protein